MDKETLSNYGWIVICVMVLAVMIALATPFGSFVADAVKSTTQGLFDVNQNALDAAGIVINNNNFDAVEKHENKIPEGGTYYVGATANTLGDYTGATVYNAGDEFPEINTGDIYVYGDYEYRYEKKYGFSGNRTWKDATTTQGGWGVRVLDDTKTTYKKALDYINEKPVTNLERTYSWCHNMTTSPALPATTIDITFAYQHCIGLIDLSNLVLPDTITETECAFGSCFNLTKAPTLPSTLVNARRMFESCESLVVTPYIPDSVTDMFGMFDGCKKLTTVTNIPKNVYSLSETFDSCTSLVTAPDLSHCDNLYYLSRTFWKCTALTTMPKLPQNVVYLTQCFEGCTSLTSTTEIPESATELGYAFKDCTALSGSITVNSNPSTWSGMIYNTSITKILGNTEKAECIMESKWSTVSNPEPYDPPEDDFWEDI